MVDVVCALAVLVVLLIFVVRHQGNRITVLENCESRHNERLRKIEERLWPNPDRPYSGNPYED